jgi:hypothetical protein
LPLLAGWLAATVAFRGRFVRTWLGGVSAGVLLRAAILGHWYAKELTFLLVALIFVGLFALVARLVLGKTSRLWSVARRMAAGIDLWHHRRRSR